MPLLNHFRKSNVNWGKVATGGEQNITVFSHETHFSLYSLCSLVADEIIQVAVSPPYAFAEYLLDTSIGPFFSKQGRYLNLCCSCYLFLEYVRNNKKMPANGSD